MTFSKVICALLISSVLAACGGGGGGGSGGTTQPPEVGSGQPFASAGVFDVNYGQFQGTYTLLDNGAFYGLHFVRGEVLAGHPHGQLTAANSVTALQPIAWANFIDDIGQVGAQEGGTFGRTFGTSVLSVAISGSMGNFKAIASAQKTYGGGSAKTIYGDPIALSALAGAYRGQVRTAGIGMPQETVAAFAIDANGAVTASALGCSFSGTMIPHGATGIFDLQLTTAGAGCKLNPMLKGVVTPLDYAGGLTKLAFQVDSLDNAHSAVFIMTKN